MTTYPAGTVAVIFVAQRTADDESGYTIAAEKMSRLAAVQPGYCGIDSVRSPDGLGITVSYWSNEQAAVQWRDNGEHSAIRDSGRDRWYSQYDLHVATIGRSYDWSKP